MANIFQTIFTHALNILFPPSKEVQMWEGMTAGEFCRRAALAVRDKELEKVRGHALFSYEDPFVRSAIHALKYRGCEMLAPLFAQMLRDDMLEDVSDHALFSGTEPLLIIPIPASRSHVRERWYNQAELIARHLASLLGNENARLATGTLTKVRDTKSQTEMKSRQARFENIAGSFSVPNPSLIADRRVLLLDDVITTGATMQEARSTLLSAGALSVECVAVAH